MTKVSRLLGAVVGSALLCGVGVLCAGDWPQWRGPNRDGKAADFAAPATWPKTLTQKWKVNVGQGDSTPALVGDKLYVSARQGGDEVTLCLDAATGKEIWKDAFAVAAIGGPSARQHSGPRSTPAVADGKVVTFGVSGVLSCLDAASGKVLWRKDEIKAVPPFYTSMSPLIVDGMAIAHLGGKGSGALMAFDLASGQEKWKWEGDAPSYASPVALTADGTRQIVSETEKSVVGVAQADGKLLWQIPYAAEGRAYNAPSPVVDGQTVILTGQGRGTKAFKIEKQGEGYAARELWSNREVAAQFSTPVLKDGMLYGLSDKGTFFCISAADGKTAWIDTTKRGGNYAGIVDAGAVILALPSNSILVVFRPDPKKFEEVAAIKVSESPTLAFPVVSGKNIFIKDADSLSLLTVE